MKPYATNSEVKERVFNESTYRSDQSESEAWIYTEVSPLRKAEHSGLIEGPSYYLIINCLDRKTGAWISFEESKSALKLKYVDEKLQQAIDQLVTNANIEINADVYGRINVR
ncbi:hypothetical protein D3C85_1396190 [compost metagenome]